MKFVHIVLYTEAHLPAVWPQSCQRQEFESYKRACDCGTGSNAKRCKQLAGVCKDLPVCTESSPIWADSATSLSVRLVCLQPGSITSANLKLQGRVNWGMHAACKRPGPHFRSAVKRSIGTASGNKNLLTMPYCGALQGMSEMLLNNSPTNVLTSGLRSTTMTWILLQKHTAAQAGAIPNLPAELLAKTCFLGPAADQRSRGLSFRSADSCNSRQ